MTINPHLIFTGIICLLSVSVFAQDKAKECPKPTTEGKNLSAIILIKNQAPVEMVGKASFTLTAMNADDSLEGIFNFTLPDKERQKIAQALQKILNDIPVVVSMKGVIGQFHKQTECPVLQLDFPAMEMEMGEAKVKLGRFTLNLKEMDDGVTIYLCTIARQINNGLGHHPVRRVNERLNCQEQP